MAGNNNVHFLTQQEVREAVREEIVPAIEKLNNHIKVLQTKLYKDKPAFTRNEAANYCGKSITWLDTQRRETGLPAHKVGGTPMFKKSDLDHLLLGGTFPK